MADHPTPYDVFTYRGYAFMETHPVRLATMAAFYGMQPTSPLRCRVLELGCGNGTNIIAVAAQCPDSTFVGIDLSARSVEAGQQLIATLGLTNITLRTASIMDIAAADGRFDYILAHGVYSWVPAEVRDKMLAICRANLTPQGVAYISYNAHPGSHLRDLVRDVMNFHVRDIADPQERVAQARAVLKAVADASIKNTVHGLVLREQLARTERMGDDVLYHDDLDVGAEAFLLHEVVAAAGAHGLQYLCDASLWRRSLDRLPESMQAMLAEFSAAAYMARDQYHDFIDGHGFRRTLLCHGEVRLSRDVGPECLDKFYLASSAAPVAPDFDPMAPGVSAFKTEAGDMLETDHLLTRMALLNLSRRWPGGIATRALIEAARAELLSKPGMQAACTDDHVEATIGALFKAACSGLIEFQVVAPFMVTEISERPEVSPLVRKQLELGTMLTSLRHDSIMIQDPVMRRLIQLVDGNRDIDQLTADFTAAARQLDPEHADKVTGDVIRHNLKTLARLALLVR